MSFWTDTNIVVLAALLADGLTYEEIGCRLGCGKNAAIGKARRLGIAADAPRAVGPEQPFSTMQNRLATLDVFPPAGRCVYRIGHPRDAGFFRFCGERNAGEGRPYCHEHAAKCHISEKSKRRIAEWADDDVRRLKAAARLRGLGGNKAQRGVA